jgi:formylglycine-generating enzyme required for sulfatase activity
MRKFLLTAVFALISAFVFAQERIAVFPFEDMENILTNNQEIMFYREFSIEFANRNAGRFSIVPRLEVERLITTEMDFQLTVFSAQEKTAEMMRVQNATQILSGAIGTLNNEIRISVSLYTYPTLDQLPGGAVLSVSNTSELFNKIPELVESMYNAITGGGRPTDRTGGTTNISDNFVRIQGGTFLMGSPSNEPQRENYEGPQHQVTVSSFYMGIYEVTQSEYQEMMGTNPSQFRGNNLPVEAVSWYDAVEYCNRRSERERLTSAYTIDKSRSDPNNQSEHDTVRWLVTWNRNANGYRLPTEAEWEYACRAGTITPFNTGNYLSEDLANYNGLYPYNSNYNAEGTYRQRTTTVGSFAPNPWGLYDMHGNVWEWCWDWSGSYSSGAQSNPQGAASGSSRVIRGGSWFFNGRLLRSAFRGSNVPSDRYFTSGFRVVRNAQ